MRTQSELIGNHPIVPNFFGRWLLGNDIPVTSTKRHRSLVGILPTSDEELIDWLAKLLIIHHYDEYRLERLKEKYKEIGFEKYAEEHRKLPRFDNTKKGNLAEILLSEYIENSLGRKLVKHFKLRYNPNVDQAMKGDDHLMVDLIDDKGDMQGKLYLGESKFRTKPTKQTVTDIVKALSRDKKPLSLTYIVDQIAKSDKVLANKLDDLIIDDIKGSGNLIYAGLLLSNGETETIVESHLNSDNPTFVLISLGIDDPERLVNLAFKKAEFYMKNPELV